MDGAGGGSSGVVANTIFVSQYEYTGDRTMWIGVIDDP
jgi:hypothetical protein